MTKTHIIEQQNDGICFPVEKVYLVRQTQPSNDCYEKTIYVLTSKEQAVEYARTLNKQYGENCRFTEDFDFIETDEDVYFDCVHYYDVQTITINKDLA